MGEYNVETTVMATVSTIGAVHVTFAIFNIIV